LRWRKIFLSMWSITQEPYRFARVLGEKGQHFCAESI
jgi:hypothetical protein